MGKHNESTTEDAKEIENYRSTSVFRRFRTASSEEAFVAGEAGDFTKAMTLAGRGGRHLYAYACAKPPLVPTQTFPHVLNLKREKLGSRGF